MGFLGRLFGKGKKSHNTSYYSPYNENHTVAPYDQTRSYQSYHQNSYPTTSSRYNVSTTPARDPAPPRARAPAPAPAPTPAPYQSYHYPPQPTTLPLCRFCGTPMVYLLAKVTNRNGNRGRPYWKCGACGEFGSFADGQGVDAGNPFCRCERPSRFQRAGVKRQQVEYFTCATGTCDFYVELGWARPVAAVSEIGYGGNWKY